jgi:ASPIC/UnbV protein
MFALRQRRTGYNRQSAAKSIEFPLTFGLGNAQKVDELTITWPSGKATTLKATGRNEFTCDTVFCGLRHAGNPNRSTQTGRCYQTAAYEKRR